MTSQSYKVQLSLTIERMNRVTVGWKNYFDYGYPRKAFWMSIIICSVASRGSCEIEVNEEADPSEMEKVYTPD